MPDMPKGTPPTSYFTKILVLPVGSYEYHGSELPPDTDSVIALEISKSVAPLLEKEFRTSTTVLPVLTYGISTEHTGMPMTAFVNTLPYCAFVRDLLNSLAGEKTFILLVSGHGGNTHALGALEGDFNYSHSTSKVFVPSIYPTPIKAMCDTFFGEYDAHAGSSEASLMAAYRQLKPREYTIRPPKRVRGVLRFFRMAELTTEGVIKRHPTVIADPAKGSRLHAAMTEELFKSTKELIVDLTALLTEMR